MSGGRWPVLRRSDVASVGTWWACVDRRPRPLADPAPRPPVAIYFLREEGGGDGREREGGGRRASFDTVSPFSLINVANKLYSVKISDLNFDLIT